MNEPKRRGRLSNAEKAARELARMVAEAATPEFAAALAGAEDRIRLSTFPVVADGARRIEPGEAVQFYVDPLTTKLAQAYALRVWNGQSPDVKRDERIRRVKSALEGQNLPFEGVELP